MTRYQATFHPQAWQRDYAIDVDPEGKTSWTITPSFLADLQTRGFERVLENSTDHSDNLRDDPAAPEWVRTWHGPFWVEVNKLDADGRPIYEL